ncbi:MAG: AAA family ATPase [Chloroflexi bacterium]|nr:AAA family ATPase [Chloroflexota bacterium]
MAELKAVLDESLSGHGQMAMVAGEPGIGKTRAASELANYAQALGAQVIWGWCYEGEGAPPYWPWIQSIRSYVRGAIAAQLASEMGAGAADIATLVPAVHEKLPDLIPSPQLEPEQARFRLFDSIATFFRNASTSSALVIILEDLHWADRSSLLLWEFMSKELSDARVMLLGTYRDVEVDRRHPLSRSIGTLIREPNFHRLLFGGLSLQDVGKFVELSAGVTLTGSNLELIYARTEGNPLFLNELVRLLADEREGAADSWTARLPEGIRDVIGRRVLRLPETCQEVLTVASVIGREFTLGQLAPLFANLTDEQLMDVLDDGLTARIIEETPNILARYQFTHALIQETMAGELSTNRRVRLHARIAEALEEFYGSEVESHAAELAHHFSEAQTVLGAEKLVRYCLLAGERGLASYAYEDALTHFERGMVARGIIPSGTEAAPDEESAALLFGLGRAQAATAQTHGFQEALNTLRRAFDYYAEAGLVAQAVAVAEQPMFVALGFTGVERLIAQALELVESDSIEAGRLMARHGYFLNRELGDYEAATKAFNGALAIARRERDAALEMEALAMSSMSEMWQSRWQSSVDMGLRAVELAPNVGNPRAEVIARIHGAASLVILGERERGREFIKPSLSLLDRVEHGLQAYALWLNEAPARLGGDWQVARDFNDRGLENGHFDTFILGTRVMLEYEVGEYSQGETFMQRLLEAMTGAPPGPSAEYAFSAQVIAKVARITGVTDRLEVAESAGMTVVSSPAAVPLAVSLARIGLSLVAVHRGDVGAAQENYAFFDSQRGIAYFDFSVDRLLGLLSQTMGNLDQAAAHFEEALAFCRKAGYRPELAWTYYDYADLLLARSEVDDLPNATEFLDQSLTIATELVMRPLMERTIARQQGISPTLKDAPAYPDGLTEREVGVMRLIASGRTNQEIGDELFISARTVANHVASIFNKTGAANRAEAATYASRNGLV